MLTNFPMVSRSTRADGNFRIPHPATPLEFTGERLTSAVEGQIEFEHYHRYCLARDLCDGRDVVDVASGEGYGSALLASIARSVVGIELDHYSVAHAEANYKAANLRFQRGDALDMPLPDSSADAVICFETLEHLLDHGRFLEEVRRVLRPGGLLVVSTPDRAVYSAAAVDPNPYHVLELTEPEFRDLLGQHFINVCILTQRPVLGSLMATHESKRWRSYERRGTNIIEATNGLARGHYLIGIATDDTPPEIPSSAYIDRRRVHDVIQDVLRLPAMEAGAAKAVQRIVELDRQVADAAHVTKALVAAEERLRAAESEVDHLHCRLADAAHATKALVTAEERLRAAESEIDHLNCRLNEQAQDYEASSAAAANVTSAILDQLANARALDQKRDRNARLDEAVRTSAILATAQAEASRAIEELTSALAATQSDASRAIEELAGALAATRSEARQAAEMLAMAEHVRIAAEHVADQVRRDIDAVKYSTSWRLTAPIRSIGTTSPTLARKVRRTTKLIWWIMTLQIGQRYVARRRLLAAAALPMALEAPQQVAISQLAPLPSVSDTDPIHLSESERQFSPSRAESKSDLIPSSEVTLAAKRNLRRSFLDWHSHIAIDFPIVNEPEVSIIIPVFRGLADVENCLRSLAAHRLTEPSFEVILVDDCPIHPVLWAIPDSGGLIKIANLENQGFLLTCNRGASAARGRFLCFLNSDTVVSAGWLRALVEALRDEPRGGLAGGMLLNEDGTIQEAGWRVLANGWGYPIGRGGAPNDGAFTYRRPVDCVTGACFVIPRPLFQDLGGFDPIYAPAFYEEFDLAFRAHTKGLKVIYEPRSRVVHLGSASYGAEWRDQLSVINHARFIKRFEKVLLKHPWESGDEFTLRHAAGEGPVLLVVDLTVPRPDRHAGDVTMSGYLSMLATAGWRVVFGSMDGQTHGPAAERLERQGIELIRAPETVQSWLQKHGPHVRHVWLARPNAVELFIDPVRQYTTAPIVYYTHDLHHLRLEREAALHPTPLIVAEAARVKELETWVFNNVDHVTSPSANEAELIQILAPRIPVTVLPPYFYEDGAFQTYDAAHFAELSDIVFVGGFPHTPNVDAALFIAKEVLPLILDECPDTRLILVGYAPPPEVRALASPNIIVTGQVSQIEPFLACARLMLVGLRYGAGVKGKTVEALRLGVPVVTTPIGAEGIGIEPGKHAIVADTAASLAKGALELLRDPCRCAALSAAGPEVIRQRFSRSAARTAIGAVFRTPRCAICGSERLIAPPLDGNYRESFVCRNCYALGRTEALGRIILARLARHGETSLAEVADGMGGRAVHEFGFVGGIADTWRGYHWFTVSDYFDGVPPGSPGVAGVRCEDLTQLTFADESFDLVISQDVMEHVPDPAKGFAETARVLRPGGSHLFTIPQNPRQPRSITRARFGSTGVEHIHPPEYHGDPVRSEGALVFTDFGGDLGAILESVGLRLIEHDLSVLGGTAQEAIRVFEAFKPPSGGALPGLLAAFDQGDSPMIDKAGALVLADLQDRIGAFETLIERCYAHELRPGMTAVDGGANYGMHTGPMAKIVGPTGRVHAFEPLPFAVLELRRMFADQPQVIIHDQALAESRGTATFNYIVNDPALSSLLKRDIGVSYPDFQTTELQVGKTVLDEFATEPVRFIKLDLEGYDYYALVGARALLERQRPIVAFEFGRRDAAIPAGYGPDDFFGFFAAIGYEILDLFGRPFTRIEFDLPWNARHMPHYVVAIPAERTDVAPRLRAEAWALVHSSPNKAPV